MQKSPEEVAAQWRNEKERNNKEYKIHVAIVEHHRSAFPEIQLVHVPNQTRDATEAFFNQKMGVEPGAYDIWLLQSGEKLSFVEVKAPDGGLSPSQIKFRDKVDIKGFKRHGIAKSVRQYHELLKSWGNIPKHNAIVEPDLRTSGEKKADALEEFMPYVPK